ncbi:glycosyl transferase family 1 [Alishewanella sp. WH16-1]|uniref:glycosyltransferase n=1 Tax=Alishewanella sp. WH16-1 TaxID=1651088 RepID=UPI00070C80CF|nr:glycosyltransferase [Alishewanella sp. WH16-1]KRS22016.1 glycosyl transferase family 1 [Alishewanella sp. WH16-1]
MTTKDLAASANRHILYVHNVAKIGGAERVTLDVIKGLPAEYKPYLVAPESGPLLDAAQQLGAVVQPLAIYQPDIKKPVKTLQNHLNWYNYLKENQIKLIHCGDLFVIRTLIWAANKLAVPIIAHVHFPIETPALRWIFRRKPKAIHFIYCSQELADAVKPRVDSILVSATHQTIHNGVDTEKYKKFEPKIGVLPAHKTNIGIVANLQERKGHLDFIEAASLVVLQHPNVHFHIIGGDVFGETREPLLRQKIAELSLTAFFTFHGQVNNVRDYLNELDIYVCASHVEAFPISVLEAMAFGLPIVSTNVNGIPEAIIDGENGVLCEPRAPEAMAKQISKLLHDRVLRERISNQARVDVVHKLSLEHFSDSVQCCYP